MLIQGQVGQTLVADGTQTNLRQGRTGELIATQAHPAYTEQTTRGSVFTLNIATSAATLTAGNALQNFTTGPAAAGTTHMALWNPIGSGVNLSLLKFVSTPISGTPTAGPIFHTVMANGLPTLTASVGVAYNNLIGGKSPVARYVASAAGATLTGSSVPIIFRTAQVSYTAAAFSAAAGPTATLIEDLGGDIVIPPGYGWVPCYPGVGTTFLCTFGVTWEEVPI
jgi:hypothetical protein